MKKIIIQAIKFFGLSGIGWLIDMCIYSLLTSQGLYVIVSNIISSFFAITFVYLLSTKKLFKNNGNRLNVNKKYIIYIFFQAVFILVSSIIISYVGNLLLATNILIILKYNKILAKIVVTPFTMLINFIVMKFLIEKV